MKSRVISSVWVDAIVGFINIYIEGPVVKEGSVVLDLHFGESSSCLGIRNIREPELHVLALVPPCLKDREGDIS